MNLLLMIAIGLILLTLLVMMLVIKRKYKLQSDYRSFFIIGIVWLPIGIVMKNYAFIAMGTAFLISGLVNHKKWRQKQQWSELPAPVRRMKIVIIVFLGVLLLTGIVFFVLANQGFIKY